MPEYFLWFEIGFEHILTLGAWDHQLFILCLVLLYPVRQWKKTILLLTLFTIGHTLSLILSAKNIISISTSLTEIGIAISLLATSIYGITQKQNSKKQYYLTYIAVGCFGLIHGLGFAHQLKSLLNREENLIKPLFYFNIGIEAAQVILVVILLVFYLLLKPFITRVNTQIVLNRIAYNIIALIAIIMVIQRIQF
jgi:hypothetical protein